VHYDFDLERIDLQKHPECKRMFIVFKQAATFDKIWRYHLPGGLDLSDLVNTGYLALLECQKSYDEEKANTYDTYVTKAVRRTMRELIELNNSFIHVTKAMDG
jgi:hypothetical protein